MKVAAHAIAQLRLGAFVCESARVLACVCVCERAGRLTGAGLRTPCRRRRWRAHRPCASATSRQEECTGSKREGEGSRA
eukprot:6190599-Pleurochrysis_carterae.AAC.1